MYAEGERYHHMQHQAQTANIHMETFGSDLAEADGQTPEKRREQRRKRGECPNCRRKTHKVSRWSNKREPLTVEGEVKSGRCLRCKPIEEGGPSIPDTLEYTEFSCDDDNMTVASEITIDPFFAEANYGKPSMGGSRRNLMSSHFESVLEEEEMPMTEYGRRAEEAAGHINELQNERREREREFVRERESHLHRGERHHPGRRRTSEEDMEESEELSWDQDQLLREMEQQRQQRFHPLAASKDLSNDFSNSEQSDSMTGSQPSSGRHKETSKVIPPRAATPKQTFHPLARIAQFSTSDRSISVNDEKSYASASIHSSDSEKIQRLCHGSRSSLMMEVDKSPPRGNASPIVAKTSPKEGERFSPNKNQRSPSHQQGEPVGASRFRVHRFSSSSIGSDEEEAGGMPSSQADRREKESNRFSLKNAPRVESREKESNRFSLNADLLSPRRRGSSPSSKKPSGFMSSDFEMEMNASKNWDSKDILRDARAEANGEDLDAAVDALFGIVDSGEDDGSTVDTEEEDEVGIMATVLSRGTWAHDEAALASTILQRRQSVNSSEGIALQLSAIKDIPVIIQAVKSRPNDKRCTERAFQSLFLLATDPDPDGSLARKDILEKGGMETLVSAIWDHMQHSQVLLALFHALWAITVFNAGDEKSTQASICKVQECRVLEGLLFAMQSHDKDLSIQESGCDLITRLAGLLPNDTPEFKSAVVMLAGNIKGMDANEKAYSSCLDALNSLCQLSDAIKREFAQAGNDCHNAIIRGLASGGGSDSPSMETRELACQLFWVVTSDRISVTALSLNGFLSKKIIHAMKSVPHATSSVHFYGAACGTLANLALEPSNHNKMIDLGVVPILCEAIYMFNFSVDVNSAACTALANLSASRDIRKSIVAQGGIPALFSAMKSTSDNADVQSEAFRALHNLCESSAEGRHAIVADLEIIISSFFRHEAVKYIQQVTCSITSRLSADENCRPLIMTASPRTLDALSKIMKSNPKKLAQKAACSALRNLSAEESIRPTLLEDEFIPLVIHAMDAHPECEEVQECACGFLLNMGSNSPEASVEICSAEGIRCIVKSMQTIPTLAPVQEAACGALAAITKGDAHKSRAISAGAVDAVIYVMLVHPSSIKVLENATRVLANLSSLKKCTKTIADAGGISTVIETMKSYTSSTSLIISGIRFIKNMALSDAEYANEAVGGIAPILECMEDHPDCAKLVEESCKALRCLVLKSESCKDRVITADGVAVIEKTINSTSQRWQTLLLDELFQ